MGFMDKIQFWKKDEALDENPFGNTASPSSQDPFEQNHNDPFRKQLNTPLNRQSNPMQQSFGQQQHDEAPNPLNDPNSATEMLRRGTISEVQPQNHPGHDLMAKDMEILSSKLDAIRSSLDSMNQRLQNIERISQNNDYKF